MPSAIFAQAAGRGKVFVVPHNTTMHLDLLKWKGGYRTFTKWDAKDITEALLDCVDGFENKNLRAVRMSEKYNKYHNTANFIELMFQEIEGK